MTLASRARSGGEKIAESARLTLSTLLQHPPLLLWALYIFAFPIYVFKSGMPQPGDWLILVLAPVSLVGWNGRLGPRGTLGLRSIIAFTIYTILINLVWTVVLNDWYWKTGTIFPPVFYLYNAVLFLVALVMHRRFGERFLFVTAKLILFTVLVQVGIAFVRGSGGRGTVLFNNPNQLGYYALLSASLLLMLQREKRISTIEVTIGSLASLYLALLSASKAALASIVLLMLVASTLRLRTMFLVAIGFGLLMLVSDSMFDALTGAMNRIETDESLGFMEERGYDRITRHPEYWITGAGEGAYYRFSSGHEIHSSIGTLFFCYGAVGTTLCGLIIYRVFRGAGMRTWLLFLPSLAYGMTHQGLRFSLFWVQIALVIALRESSRTPPVPPR